MKIEVIPNEQTPKVPVIDNIDNFLNANKELLHAFKSFASSRNDAAGLAANQVSVDSNRLMINIFGVKNRNSDEWQLILNPEITNSLGGTELKLEGCLTWKDKAILANRSEIVYVTYYDEEGILHEGEVYRGFDAQVWQHEVHHLLGIEEKVVDLDFKIPPRVKIGRNELCPCGSGKKYKNCCMNK